MRYSFRLLTMTWLVAAGQLQAQDLTVFGGFQHPGTLTLRSGVDGIGSTVGVQPGVSPGEFKIDPKAFGTFGIRLYRSAAPLGLEHTVAYSPKFLDTGGRAFLYSTNLRMEFPHRAIPALRHRWWGSLLWRRRRIASFGSKYSFNYGAGLMVEFAGPLGLRFDARTYSIRGIDDHPLKLLEASTGIVLGF